MARGGSGALSRGGSGALSRGGSGALSRGGSGALSGGRDAARSAAARRGGALTRAGVGLGLGLGVAIAVGEARRRARQWGGEQAAAAPDAAAFSAVGEERRTSANAEPPTPVNADAGVGATVASGLLEQLNFAIATLHDASDEGLEKAVHETRKAIKRTRSTLRLLSEQLPTDVRRRSNATLRDAGRCLSSARDADVALATLERVLDDTRKRVQSSAGVACLRSSLVNERDAARRELHGGGARERALALLWRARAELSPALAAIETRAQERPKGGKRTKGGKRNRRAAPAPALRLGLARIYERGRSAMRTAESKRSAVALHEWRKRAKDLRYATEALGAAGGADGHTPTNGRAGHTPTNGRAGHTASGRARRKLAKIAKRAEELGEMLGEEHDLALLEMRVEAEKRMFKGERRARKELLRSIARQRRMLQHRAFDRGERLFEASGGRFRGRARKLVP